MTESAQVLTREYAYWAGRFSGRDTSGREYELLLNRERQAGSEPVVGRMEGETVAVETDGLPARLLSALHAISVSGPLHLYAGRDHDHQAVFLNLECPASWHVLVQGQPGSGKSDTIRNLVTSLALNARQSQIQIMGVDIGGRELGLLESFPHMLTDLASDIPFSMRLLAWLDEEVTSRIRSGNSWPQLVLVIDDLERLLVDNQSAVRDIIFRLLVNGRHAGLHIIAALNHSLGTLLGTRAWKLNPAKLKMPDKKQGRSSAGVQARNVHIVRRGRREYCEAPWMSANDMNIAVRLMNAGWRINRDKGGTTQHVLQ